MRHRLFSPVDGRSIPYEPVYDPAAARSEEAERELGRFFMGVQHLPPTAAYCSIGGDNIVYCHFMLRDSVLARPWTLWREADRRIWCWKVAGTLLEVRMPWVKFDRRMMECGSYRLRNVCWDDYTKELFSRMLAEIDGFIRGDEHQFVPRAIQEMPPPHFFQGDDYQSFWPTRLPGWIERRNNDPDNLVLGVKPRFSLRRR